MNKLLRLPEVMQITGLARTTLHTLEKQNRFPRRLKITRRAVAWHQADIEAWVKSRVKNGTPP